MSAHPSAPGPARRRSTRSTLGGLLRELACASGPGQAAACARRAAAEHAQVHSRLSVTCRRQYADLWGENRQVRFWIISSAVLLGLGVAIVFLEGYFAITGGGTGSVASMFAGAGTGFSGMGLLAQAIQGKLQRFPAGALRKKAIRLGVAVIGLSCAFVTFGAFAISGITKCAPSVVVMWICFLSGLMLIMQISRIKREALAGRTMRLSPVCIAAHAAGKPDSA